MREEIYELLKLYKLTPDEILYIEERNEDSSLLTVSYCKDVLKKLKEIDFTDEEIRHLLLSNVYMISSSLKKIDYLNDIYFKELKMTKEELHNLAIQNNKFYTISPIELQDGIKILNLTEDYSKIKTFILENPKKLTLKKEEFVTEYFDNK